MKDNTRSTKRKQSIVAGALVSSAGIFFAKLIGLIYAIPFNNILGTNVNVEYYAITQSLYMYLLNVCQAGFPFAIVTLVARYTTKGDYKTSIFVKKLSTRLMISLGFVMMLLFMLFSKPIAHMMYDGAGSADDLRWAFVGSSFALFFVPILSSMRGFYQGLKEMEIYSLSQVLEQLANASFVLIASSIAVYIFHGDHIWAVYFGVFSTSVAAITAMIHLKFYDRKRMKEIRRLAHEQAFENKIESREILKELLYVSIPFMLIALLGYSDSIINTLFLQKGLKGHGLSGSEITLISSTINYKVVKLMSIPMVLAPGFSSAIIPHITSAITQHNMKQVRKNIRDCIDIVLYIALPVSFCLYVFAEPLIVTLFPPEHAKDIPAVAQIIRWFSIVAFLDTMTPIVTNLMVATGLRRNSVRNTTIQVVVKFALSYIMLVKFSYQGLVFSTVISAMLNISISLYELTKHHDIQWKYTLHRLFVILCGCGILWILAQLCFHLGLRGNYEAGRGMAFIQMAFAGGISCIGYFAFTYVFHLPQTLLHLDFAVLFKKRKRG